MNPKTKKWTDSDYEFVKQNISLKNAELAEQLKLPLSVIKNMKHNYRILKYPKLNTAQKILIKRLKIAGVKTKAIAEWTRLPYHKVHFFIRKHCN